MRKGKLSILLFAYNSGKRIENTLNKMIEYFDHTGIDYEIIVTDDGSTDNTYEIAKNYEKKYPGKIKVIRLSKNFTTPYAQFAALSVCTGDCAVFAPDDMQKPPELLHELYKLWQQGHQLIFPHRRSRKDGLISDFFSNLYYKIMNWFSDVQFPPGGTDGFLADREIIDILNTKIHPINTSPTVEALRLGFDPVYFPYDRPPTKSKSRWTFKKKLRLAFDTFFTTSTFPIKIIAYLGLFTFLFSIFLIIGLLYIHYKKDGLLFGVEVRGWWFMVIFISLFSGLILFSLGIIAEYIWRILDETKNRPGYI
ncbi:MAG: glycosyltransferase, partial [Bacteroidetes bacterium]